MTAGYDDIVAGAEAVWTAADLARVLRVLRRREARDREGPELTYREISDRTGWSVSVIGGYFTGVKLPSMERFDELVRLLGARPREQGALSSAWERAVAARAGSDCLVQPGGWPTPAPRMLPSPVACFTGRSLQLARLDALVAADPGSRPVVISAVDGMAGVGKTALAVHWAHSAVSDFPDGQLYVNLRGYDPSEPLSTMDALGVLLGGLGLEPASISGDLPGRVGQYQRSLAGRRMLVLLDNARGPEQVRPLLPPPPSVVVVTSRDDLAELITVDGAGRVSLDVLPEEEALALLRLLVGEQADREPDAARLLARRCGYLPLALRVAAEQVAFRPAATLAELVGELHDEAMDGLHVPGDERADLSAVFSWSLSRLPAPDARAFHLLGLVPGSDVDVYGLAALAEVDLPEAQRLAARLARAHLIESGDHGRLSMHDLLRAYARDVVDQHIEPGERHAVTSRLLDYYLTAATVAVNVQMPGGLPGRYRNRPTPVLWTLAPSFDTFRAASDWLAVERDNMVHACEHAAKHGWPSHAVALALALGPFLALGHDEDGLIVHTGAMDAARSLGATCDPLDVAYLDLCLGWTYMSIGNLDNATEHAARALEVCVRWDCAEGASSSYTVLGGVADMTGRCREAVGYLQRGLDAARSVGHRPLEAAQLANLGMVHMRMEELATAAELYEQATALADELGRPLDVAECEIGLAAVYTALGRHNEALTVAQRALVVETEHDRWPWRAQLMTVIAEAYRGQGRLTDALEQLTEVAAACRGSYPAIEAFVHNALGETHLAAGDHGGADDCHRRALEFADKGGDRIERARALAGLGDARHSAGETAQAQEYWRQAHHSYAEMGLPAAERVHARLVAS